MKPLVLLAIAAFAAPVFAAGGVCDTPTQYVVTVALADVQVKCGDVIEATCPVGSAKWIVTGIQQKGLVFNSAQWSRPSSDKDTDNDSAPVLILPQGISSCAKDFTFYFELDAGHPTYKDVSTGKQVSYLNKVVGAQAEAYFVDANGAENGRVSTASAEKDKHILVTVPAGQFFPSQEGGPSKIIIGDPRLPAAAQTIKIYIQTSGGTPG